MSSNAAAPSGASVKSDRIFEMIKKEIGSDPSQAKQINAIFQFNITKDGKTVSTWTIDCKKVEVHTGNPKGGKADTTFTLSDDDFIDLVSGKLNPQMAFMKGKLKLTGNVMLADKIKGVLQQVKAKL